MPAASFKGGGRGCNKFVPVLGGDGTKIVPPEDVFDQPPDEMNWIRGKLADHTGDHVVLSPEGVVLVPSPGTEPSYPRPPQSLKHSASHPIPSPDRNHVPKRAASTTLRTLRVSVFSNVTVDVA